MSEYIYIDIDIDIDMFEISLESQPVQAGPSIYTVVYAIIMVFLKSL